MLLACSDGDYVEDRHGLDTATCLDFLLDLGTRDARVCGYYLSYDWTKVVADLDDKAIHLLFRPELRQIAQGAFSRVEYKQFKLHWLAGAMWLSDGKRKVTIWDLGKYYQGPFIGALKDWNIRPDVQDEIAKMKARRSQFTLREMPRIRRYCLNECEALAEFAAANEAAHTAAGLKPRGWFGPGSTAGALLSRHDIHEKRGTIPPLLVEPVACAFFGGRAEISRKGFIQGPISAYDISSAYPAEAANLPCLEHGQWERVTSERAIKGARVAHAIVHGHIGARYSPPPSRASWGALPVRLSNSFIVFPQCGASGWWWRDEWLAAREGWGRSLEFDHAYVLRRECKCKPFAFLPELFERRRQIGKESGEGKVLKLALNSCYGKLAQTVGGPKFASRVWAGMITSGTRAQILKMMLRHDDLANVLMIATDGLFSTEQHEVDQVEPLGEPKRGSVVLGGWERKDHESITLVRPGIYWHGSGKLRARGLGRDSLDVGKALLLEGIESGVERVELPKRVAFGGAKLTVYATPGGELKRSAQYGQWHEIPTHVSLAPGPKRAPDWSPPTLTDVQSAPYGTRNTRATGEYFELMEAIRDLLEQSGM